MTSTEKDNLHSESKTETVSQKIEGGKKSKVVEGIIKTGKEIKTHKELEVEKETKLEKVDNIQTQNKTCFKGQNKEEEKQEKENEEEQEELQKEKQMENFYDNFYDEEGFFNTSKENKQKNIIKEKLNDNLFYFKSRANIKDIYQQLSLYTKNPKTDIGIIKPLRKKNNIMRYSYGTLVLMKNEIYENNKENSDFLNTFFKIKHYVYDPKIKEQYENNKTLFIKLPSEIPNYVCAEKIKELIKIFENFGLLKENAATLSIPASNRFNERFETKYSSIHFSEDTPFSSIECFRVLLNMLDVEYETTGKLNIILCKYDEGKKTNLRKSSQNNKKPQKVNDNTNTKEVKDSDEDEVNSRSSSSWKEQKGRKRNKK
jgi:hypothetical protein